MEKVTRRLFLATSCGGMVTWKRAKSATCDQRSEQAPILKLQFGKPTRYPNSHGDLWTATWGNDDNLYVASDDTWGFDKACNSNLAISRISGDMPPDIHGVTVNPMKEFGGQGEVNKDDGAMWKACGLTCVDGVLYLSVSRHLSPPDLFCIQETWDASIIKSADHGLTWSPAPKLGHAMFPGHAFSTPFFVDYGKNSRSAHDGSEEYVYAVSNDGCWNNGNSMVLGRVRRERIGRLDPHDWEFVQGFEMNREPVWPEDWMCLHEFDRRVPMWGPRYDKACSIFRSPGQTSMTGIHYIAPLNLYILPQWSYLPLRNSGKQWARSRLEFYEAPAPWGPWKVFHTQDFEPEGWYNPCIPSKFVSRDGRRFWVFVSGDWKTGDTNQGLYGLWMAQVTLEF